MRVSVKILSIYVSTSKKWTLTKLEGIAFTFNLIVLFRCLKILHHTLKGKQGRTIKSAK